MSDPGLNLKFEVLQKFTSHVPLFSLLQIFLENIHVKIKQIVERTCMCWFVGITFTINELVQNKKE